MRNLYYIELFSYITKRHIKAYKILNLNIGREVKEYHSSLSYHTFVLHSIYYTSILVI